MPPTSASASIAGVGSKATWFLTSPPLVSTRPARRAVSFPAMNIEVRKVKDVTVVDFKGRLAVGVGDEVLPHIINSILEEGNKKILLNLSEMDYIDSNGLGELVQSLKTSKRYGASLRLLKPQDRVARTLRLTNLLPMFSVYESEADALKSF